MPMIDIYVPEGLVPASKKRELAKEMTLTLLKAEGVTKPGQVHLDNTAAYIHELPATDIHTAATDQAKVVRIQVLTPPRVLTRDGQKFLVKEATDLIAKVVGDESQKERTWVLLTEAADGGWGINGTAYDLPGFVKLLSSEN